jgi:hypothetical protein
MAKALSIGSNKVEKAPKRTSIGRGRVAMSSMNKKKKASWKKYRGQGK